MLGPIAATRWAGALPKARVSSATVRPPMPAAVPRHPACTAATAPVAKSPIRTGTQSATCTVSRKRRSRVITASASGGTVAGAVASSTRVPCTCRSPTTSSSVTPASAASCRHPWPFRWLPRSIPSNRVVHPWWNERKRRQTSAGPHELSAHSKSLRGDGRLVLVVAGAVGSVTRHHHTRERIE